MSNARRQVLGALAVAGLAAAVALLVSRAGAAVPILDGLAVLALGAVLAGARRHPPRGRALAGGLAALILSQAATATTLVLLGHHLRSHPLLAALPDAFVLSAYAAQVVVLVRLGTRFGERRTPDTMIDVAIAAIGIGWAALILLTIPALQRGAVPMAVRVPLAVAPFLGVLVVLASVRLLTTARTRPAAVWLFAGAGLAALASNLGLAFSWRHVGDPVPTLVQLGWLVAIALAGVVGLVPLPPGAAPAAAARLDGARALRLGLALAAGPVAEAINLVRDHQGRTAAALTLPTFTAVGLVFARIGRLFRSVMRSQEELSARERYYRALVERVKDYVVVLDGELRPRYASPALLELLGLAPAEMFDAGGSPRFVLAEDRGRFASVLERALRQPGSSVSEEVRVRDAAGEEHYCIGSTTNLLADPAVGGLVVVLHDASEAKQLERQLRHQALHDALTGLPNRALVLDRVAHASARASERDGAVTVLFVDLDDFKEVNDTFGHGAGDELLQAVAGRLRGTLRHGDTVGRIGGDEFVIVSDATDTAPGSPVLAERVLAALAEPFALSATGAKSVRVGASVGVATGSGEDAEVLMRNADLALYAAKAAGKHRYAAFRPEMHAELEERLHLGLELQEALERGEFFLLYQPHFDLETLAVSGVEALLRWRHPERGTIGPDEFMPVLETSELIVAVGTFVLRSACAQAAAWAAAGTPLSVGVNVSARQLGAGFPDTVRAVLAETGVDAHLVVLEITESVLVHDVAGAARQLEALRRLGVRIAIDDFGTGYASLGYLRELPIDILKIDRSFVAGLGRAPQAASLVRTLIRLGRDLGLHTIAEGIEDAAQLAALRGESCDAGQGYHLAAARPAAEIDELVRDNSHRPLATRH